MDLNLYEFSYRGLKFRAFCDRNGKNGKLVLEDIVSILLKLSRDIRDFKEVTRQQLLKTNIETIEHEGIHLATSDSMLDFYLGCENLCNAYSATDFKKLAEILANQISYRLTTNMFDKVFVNTFG